MCCNRSSSKPLLSETALDKFRRDMTESIAYETNNNNIAQSVNQPIISVAELLNYSMHSFVRSLININKAVKMANSKIDSIVYYSTRLYFKKRRLSIYILNSDLMRKVFNESSLTGEKKHGEKGRERKGKENIVVKMNIARHAQLKKQKGSFNTINILFIDKLSLSLT